MIVLGINDGHDAGVCLFRDGEVLLVSNEERRRNVKNHAGIPDRSIAEVFRRTGVEPKDVDLVTLSSLIRTTFPTRGKKPIYTVLHGLTSLARSEAATNLGRRLARELESDAVRLCFAGRGNRMDELRKLAEGVSNVMFAGFAPESELERRLGACDLHLVSLRAEWAGTVVPSKFFGALAAGRGVVYAGPPDSAVARWIDEYQVGWVLTPANVPAVAADLRRLAALPADLAALNARCHAVYQEHFSKAHQIARWDAELRRLVGLPS